MQHVVYAVCEPHATDGFLYTQGLHPTGSELFALDVPAGMHGRMSRTLNALATRGVGAGDIVHVEGQPYLLATVNQPRRTELQKTTLLMVDHAATVLQVVPIGGW